jgi:hypothetical protein
MLKDREFELKLALSQEDFDHLSQGCAAKIALTRR